MIQMRKRLCTILLLTLAYTSICAQGNGLSLIAPPAMDYNLQKSTIYDISTLHAKRLKEKELKSIQIYNVPLKLDSLYRSKRTSCRAS